MTSSNPQSTGLRKAMGALSLGFLMAATNAPVNANEPPPPPGTTTSSAMLADIERQANDYLNATKNPNLRVVMIDVDQVNTMTGPNMSFHSQKLSAYLKERGVELQSRDGGTIRWALGAAYGPTSANPQALHATTLNSKNKKDDVCIVAPETTDLSSRSLIEKWVGKAGPHHLQAAIDPGPYQMTKRVAWHEAWHCMDREFVQAYESIHRDLGFEFAHGIHRAEMFADVAATLTMASKGDPQIMKDTADLRAVFSRWYGPKMMDDYSPKTDAPYYAGITYYTTPAHDAALAHINTVGLDKVKNYSLADIQRIATDLTRKHALNNEQFRAVSDYLKQGESYLRAQNQRASSGDATAKRNVAFLNDYKTRTDTARARVVTPTNIPVPVAEDVVPPTMEDILLATPNQKKLEIFTAMETAATLAQRSGQTARQGVFNQLESWRKELHTAPTRRADLEQKLYLAGLMLSNGYLDTVLAPGTAAPAPKPSL